MGNAGCILSTVLRAGFWLLSYCKFRKEPRKEHWFLVLQAAIVSLRNPKKNQLLSPAGKAALGSLGFRVWVGLGAPDLVFRV